MPTEQQVEILNKAHNVKAVSNSYGKGVNNCSIHKWHGHLTEYTVPALALPMIAIQTSGRAKVRRINNNHTFSVDYVMQGDMTIIPSNVELSWAINGVVDVTCIIFENSQTCERLMEIYENAQTATIDKMFVGSFTDSFIYSTCKHLLNVLSNPETIPENYVNTFFYSLEMYVLNYLGKKNVLLEKKGHPSHQVNYALKRLSLEVKNKIYVEDIAKELRVSPSYLSRKFKEEVGISPHDFLLSKRIKIAQKLLAETDLDIVSIADETGFSSQSHLTRYFSKYVELSPSKYRKYTKKGNISSEVAKKKQLASS